MSTMVKSEISMIQSLQKFPIHGSYYLILFVIYYLYIVRMNYFFLETL